MLQCSRKLVIMSAEPPVGIVLVNWNALTDTLECLESLARQEYCDAQIIVVDNGSRDGQAEAIRQHHPTVHLHAAGRNLGYTGGNNLGIRLALEQGVDYVLCLNNDTLVAPDFLSRLIAAMQCDPRAGLATPALYEAHRPEVLAGLGCELHLGRMLCGDAILKMPADISTSYVVPYVEGCALLMRRIVAEQTGGFDDRLFAYLEDADLCLRARIHGWHCLAVPSARIWHKVEGKSTGVGSPVAWFYSARNSVHLSRRYATAEERRALRRDQCWGTYHMLRDCLKLQATRVGESIAQRANNQFISLVLGIVAGRLRFYGDRCAFPWRVIEWALRPCLSICMQMLMPFVYMLLPLKTLLRGKHRL